MASYETIYQLLTDRYDDESLSSFFNQHERDVIRRKALPIATDLMANLRLAKTAKRQMVRDAHYHQALAIAKTLQSLTDTDPEEVDWFNTAEQKYKESGQGFDSNMVLANRLIIELYP